MDSIRYQVRVSSLRETSDLVVGDNLEALLRDSRLGDAITFEDTSAYHYRIVDFIPSGKDLSSGHKYQQCMPIASLQQYPEAIMRFGSLFGSSRLWLRDSRHRDIRTRIRRAMTFTNPLLNDISSSIASILTEDTRFLGAHVRVGDGEFKEKAQRNVRHVWQSLVQDIALLEQEVVKELDELVWNFHDQSRQPLSGHRWDERRDNVRCRRPSHRDPRLQALNTPLFIATDVANPSSSPFIEPVLRTFPCTFFLSDFLTTSGIPETSDAASPFEVATTHPELSALASRLRILRNPRDNLLLLPFLIPLIDAFVISRANGVVGTPGSTFSAYVEDVLWRVQQGLSIAERG
ncbi:hypothetical protein PUNSTDRAFT_83502, partial [Punctularia strigosozonata HHB-11173 SS5]|uniref:uncharacterized protein n=1 Tax=Punctularia strigosozonata (strain HHB-11173) TaxID=741275 RepID=UPI0004416E03